ncbi:hypothetical protein PVAP13_6KG231906 [Panicum virgatum]|uniref:Uncharacterized protein n=1 Tax=Panicum virgatum TaxID=38727 RepID=A0A8T0RJD6_PANVG|nr:hypothetical protein PVAP13_6KG231906 [Panicum virgatum]
MRRPATDPPRPPPSRCSSPPPPLTPRRNRSTGEEGWRGEERRPRPASRSRAARGAATGERKRSGGGAWARSGERRGSGAGAHGPKRGGCVIIEAGVEVVEEGVGRGGLAVGIDIGGGASGADQSSVGELVAAVAAGRHGPEQRCGLERGGHVVVEAGVEEVKEGLGRDGLTVGIGRAASGVCGRAAQTRAAVASWRPAPPFFDFFYVS